jgi:hypothetical protein
LSRLRRLGLNVRIANIAALFRNFPDFLVAMPPSRGMFLKNGRQIVSNRVKLGEKFDQSFLIPLFFFFDSWQQCF